MLLFFSGSLLCVSPLHAEHEADHRYVVSGQVTDDAGKYRKNVTVSLEHKGGQKKSATTDGSGRYEVLFHLHNDNLGDEIVVSVGEVQKNLTISFDPEDGVSFRGITVNFGAPAESAAVWIYLTGASLTVLAIVVYFGLIKNKKKNKIMDSKLKQGKKKKRKKK